MDNHGYSINFNGGNLTLTSSATTVGLAATAGDGTLSNSPTTELTCLGRVVAQASGSAGSLSLSPTALAPGDNVIVPVLVFSASTQVAGGAFVVHVESGPVNSWNGGGGNMLWSNTANWTSGVLPQNGDNVARFSGAAGGGTVTVDRSASVEEIDFDNSGGGSYTIAALPGQTLTLSSSNGAASECLVNVLSGSHTISAPLVLAAAGNLVNVTNPADCLTISGSITGVGAVTKTGSGLLLLAANNSYGGATIVSAGTLELGAAAGLPNGTAATVNGTLDLNAFGATVSSLAGIGTVNHSGTGGDTLAVGSGAFAGTIENTGGTLALLKIGSGQLILSGSNTYTGGTTVSAGVLAIASTASLPGWASGSGTVDAGAILAVQPGGNSGWGNAQIATLLGSIKWSSSTASFGIDTTNGSVTFNGNLTLPPGLGFAKLGANTLILAGSSTCSGVTAIGGGILSLGAAAAGGGNFTFGGGTLQFTSSNTTDYSAQLKNSTAAPISIDTNGQSVNFGNSIDSSNTAGLVKTGNGTLTLGVNNNYLGGTMVSGGTLVAASNSALSSGPVVLSPSSGPATLAFTSLLPSIGSLAGSGGSSSIVLGNATAGTATVLTVGTDNTSTTFSGAISDLISVAPAAVGSLTKAGSGTLLLTGVNTYSGSTSVSNGVLEAATTASLPGYNTASEVSVAAGAVLAVPLGDGTTGWNSSQIATLLGSLKWSNSTAAFGIDTTNGSATYSGNLPLPPSLGFAKLGANALILTGSNTYSGATVVSGGTLSIGDGSTFGAWLATPSVSVNSGATLEFDLPDAQSYGGTIGGLGQLLKAGAGQLTLTGNNGYSGATTISAGTLRLGSPGAAPAASSIVASGGTLDLGGNTLTSTGASILFVGGVVQNGSLVYAGTYSALPGNGATATVFASLGGSAGLNMTGSGTLFLAGVNTYTGNTSVINGVLEAATTASLPGYATANAVSVAGGAVLAVQTSGGATTGWNAAQIGSLLASASWSNSTPNNAPALGIDTTNGDFTYGGSIPQAIGLTKLGANNLTLTAASTMNGNVVGAGPGTLTIAATLAFRGVDDAYNPLGIVQIHQGQINVISGGALTNLSEIDVGDTPGQTGTLALSSGSALVPYASNYYSGVNVGYNGGAGILNLTGRSDLNVTPTNGGGNFIEIGFDNNNTTGSAGTATVAGNSTLRAAGSGAIVVGDGGTGTLVITGSGLVETSYFQLGSQQQSGAAGGTGTLYVNGGTLSVPQVQNAPGATGNLYFNGGTLQATAASGDFLQSIGGGTLHAYVQARGGVIDSNGNSITINQVLAHDPSDPTADGGLTKAGAGTLTLTGANTYSGGTTIGGGVLQFANTTAMPASGTVTVESGAALAVNAGGTNEFTAGTSGPGTIGGLLAGVGSRGAPVSWTSGAILGIDTTNAGGGILTYAGDIVNPAGNTLGLTKLGSNTLVLSGTNTYAGGTTVLSGTLVLMNNEALADGTSLTVGDAAAAFGAVAVPAAASPGAPAAVPEPGTLVLLLTAGLWSAVVHYRFRRRSKTAAG